MGAAFLCRNRRRRQAVADSLTLNGIDYLEVDPDGIGTLMGQRTLAIHFLHSLPGQPGGIPAAPALDQSNILIEGGARVVGITVVAPLQVAGDVLRVTTSSAGDFSTYTLRLVASATQPMAPPAGFDPQLAAVAFSFKIDCPSEFDCATSMACSTPSYPEPDVDYLAKDYRSFRRLLLDRLTVTSPGWRERHAADVQVALVEVLAYVADHLSYFQDAVATEAYLGTARRRVSVRRHARMLDYYVHDGVNARAWVALEVRPAPIPGPKRADGAVLPARTMILTTTSLGGAGVDPGAIDLALRDDPTVFETLHDLELSSAHNGVLFYAWGDSQCCLPKGATRATLRDRPALGFVPGDVVVFEEVLGPKTGRAADADPTHRQAVRLTATDRAIDPLDGTPVVEIQWDRADALRFPLCVSADVEIDGVVQQVSDVSVVRGNVVLADHGRTMPTTRLEPDPPPARTTYRPLVPGTGLTFAVPYDDQATRQRPAADALVQDPRQALPSIVLEGGNEIWRARRDLISSDRFAADFVVETESDGSAQLRFGDNVLGKFPEVRLDASYRLGTGTVGNVGAEALSQVVTALEGVERVRNPLPARGGTERETLDEVRQYAPQAFRVQERAVTEADWAEVAERDDRVQKAAGTYRWTGSWYTAFVSVDREGGGRIDEAFEDSLRASLERYRLAGYDLEINGPRFVPLDIALRVCVQPGYIRSDVKRDLLQVFSSQDLPDGRRGFFHPDNFTFGQPLYLSRIYETALAVAGVASVETLTFQRWGYAPAGETEAGAIRPDRLEIIQLENDLNFPENGKIEFDMQGGL